MPAISRLLSFLLVVVGVVCAYRPVVIVHGLLDDPHSLDYLHDYIEEVHPGTNVTILNMFHGWKSLAPLWLQVMKYSQQFRQLMNESVNGINVIGYSQGGLISRGLFSSINNHNVHTFISLSSPQMGQYGNGGILKYFFPSLVKELAYKFFYTLEGQLCSIGNFWNDPHHGELFLNMSAFLPLINNLVKHPMQKHFKENFQRLERVVLIGGPDDGIVTPWQSSQFAFYNRNETVVPMEEQKVYIEDTIGLKHLNSLGRLIQFTMAGVDHFGWHKNKTVFDRFIIPFLD